MTIYTNEEKETYDLAVKMGREAQPGTVITLDGDLGAGKTVFAKGFAEGLGVNEPVVSPTFTIVHEYHSGRMPLYHFDVYRIEDEDEMDEIGYEDYFYGNGACLIEWSRQISDIIPEDARRILINRVPEKGDNVREIIIED